MLKGYVLSNKTVSLSEHFVLEAAIYSQLSLAKKRSNGYLQSTVFSQKTLKWLFTVNCH